MLRRFPTGASIITNQVRLEIATDAEIEIIRRCIGRCVSVFNNLIDFWANIEALSNRVFKTNAVIETLICIAVLRSFFCIVEGVVEDDG